MTIEAKVCGFPVGAGWSNATCQVTTDGGRCYHHARMRCRFHGAQATHLCSATLGFVCGSPLCDRDGPECPGHG